MLEVGSYKIYALSGPQSIADLGEEKAKSYTLQKFGWFAAISPFFTTSRSSLGLHPDGNIEGSLGCVVFPFENLNENKKMYQYISDGLEKQNQISFEVIKKLGTEDTVENRDAVGGTTSHAENLDKFLLVIFGWLKGIFDKFWNLGRD